MKVIEHKNEKGYKHWFFEFDNDKEFQVQIFEGNIVIFGEDVNGEELPHDFDKYICLSDINNVELFMESFINELRRHNDNM